MKYTCEVIEDPYNEGEFLLNLPDELCSEMGWIEGDDLLWSIEEDGTVTLRKKENT